jgi:hypothetical protein
LNLRRQILDMHHARSEVGKIWLQIGKIARTSHQLQIAGHAVMKADTYHPSYYHLERAKLMWKSGNTHQALLDLQDELRRARELLSGPVGRSKYNAGGSPSHVCIIVI